jgi:hypothetical protein
MTKRNTASRLYEILYAGRSLAAERSTTDTWASLFGIEETNAIRRGHQVADRLSLMGEQLDELRASVQAREISETTYQPHFDHIEHVIHAHHLAAQWKGVSAQISGEMLLLLKFCWDLLPADEEEIPADQFERLLGHLADLENTLAMGTTPPELRRVIRKQIKRIRESLTEYRVSGVHALHQAVRAAAIDLMEFRRELHDREDDDNVVGLRNVLAEIATMASNATKSNQEADATNRLLGLTIEKLLIGQAKPVGEEAAKS